jgi:hypothetical protein
MTGPAFSADVVGRASVIDGDTLEIHGTRITSQWCMTVEGLVSKRRDRHTQDGGSKHWGSR